MAVNIYGHADGMMAQLWQIPLSLFLLPGAPRTTHPLLLIPPGPDLD